MRIGDDIRAIMERDPAARNRLEALLYPGLHALLLHRLAHKLWRARLPVVPRLISQVSRFLTGIEIHPGATIGRGLFIDHGMGVVIGETAEIGDNVTLYQGVTLGGTGKQTGKRHPTIGDNVLIGVGAAVLGAITVGENARIGGGAVVLRDVPPDTTAVGVPARIVAYHGTADNRRIEDLPDPEGDIMGAMQSRLDDLEARLTRLLTGHIEETRDGHEDHDHATQTYIATTTAALARTRAEMVRMEGRIRALEARLANPALLREAEKKTAHYSYTHGDR